MRLALLAIGFGMIAVNPAFALSKSVAVVMAVSKNGTVSMSTIEILDGGHCNQVIGRMNNQALWQKQSGSGPASIPKDVTIYVNCPIDVQ